MNELRERILALKEKKKALILAHYYQVMDVQDIADHVCDSFEMARRAFEAKEELLIICGVRFMAESAKILNPEKTVLLPAPEAGCPMADMITPKDVGKLKAKHPDAAIVCYVNSSAAVKAVSDICCTSSSAEKIVRALPQKQIVFIPDRNLGAYIASKIPDKEIILFDGCCPTHDAATEDDAIQAKQKHPGAKLLIHPECGAGVLRHADYIGSTAGIISHALDSGSTDFIIGTETGVVERLKRLAPEKGFYPLKESFLCPDMKKTSLADIYASLDAGTHEIILEACEMDAARKCLERMVETG